MIKSISLGEQILEMIDTLEQAIVELYELATNKDRKIYKFSKEMQAMLTAMYPVFEKLAKEESALMSGKLCKNVEYSLANIMYLLQDSSNLACQKIEYELLPLAQELYTDFYFWGFCYPDNNKMWNFYRNEMNDLCPLPYIKESEKINSYKYDLSIVLPAYNKLNFTKECVKYLFKYLPDNLSYELICINNGSNDETKLFFESIHPNKQIDIIENTKSFSVVSRIIEGKYTLFLSNDVILTPNAISNLLTCIKSDETIGCVAPTCPNVSNLQEIPAEYSSIKEMIDFSIKNNISNPYRWEQRARLTPPVALARSNNYFFYALFCYTYPYTPDRVFGFSDDLMSLLMRRNGYKLILAKDTYVYHFGDNALKDYSSKKQNFYQIGRKRFYDTFGIDPWGEGLCYDLKLVSSLSFSNVEPTEPTNILGINCGIGSDPLKIKEILKETYHNINVIVYNITNNSNFSDDLRGVSDKFQYVKNIEMIKTLYDNIHFKYIIIEGSIEKQKNPVRIINKAYSLLTQDGILAVKVVKLDLRNSLKGLYMQMVINDEWIIIKRI
ncbi:glycosyltransferase [Caproiciproducens sp. LBM24188]|nr:glycosyltransferase family 2 protein [Oscillospiraceae bacterium]HHV31307.1 glycosyltransferase family 2 protein [Clostridiales bacterium]